MNRTIHEKSPLPVPDTMLDPLQAPGFFPDQFLVYGPIGREAREKVDMVLKSVLKSLSNLISQILSNL